ncbi:MAG: sigma-70 family RNA polymerase sigma factor [Clostridia bacterium]|nr:sigma-70 family RNA polymerase sigma factor [Oscillospiraceae bacterium]MBR2446389.1 sigma-70 family RNA polymerase sigma factor [Clostridia bacterium]
MLDSQIIALYDARDERAIAETAAKYGSFCTSIALNILQNLQDAEECVNDTWLRTWNSIPPARPNVLKAYLGRITRNLALDKYKAARREKRGCGEIEVAFDEISEITASDYALEDEWREQDFVDLINAFLYSLPERDRHVFVRRYFFTDSVPAIAKRFGTSQNNVLKILSRTRQKLKNYLDREWTTL